MKILLSLALLFFISTMSWAQVNRELVGKYQMDVQGGDTLELRADGTASLAGDNMKWSVRGNQLQVGPDVMSSSGGMMLWKVENLRLLIDQRNGTGFQDIGLTTSKNSNGYPHAEGREYSMCS